MSDQVISALAGFTVLVVTGLSGWIWRNAVMWARTRDRLAELEKGDPKLMRTLASKNEEIIELNQRLLECFASTQLERNENNAIIQNQSATIVVYQEQLQNSLVNQRELLDRGEALAAKVSAQTTKIEALEISNKALLAKNRELAPYQVKAQSLEKTVNRHTNEIANLQAQFEKQHAYDLGQINFALEVFDRLKIQINESVNGDLPISQKEVTDETSP